MGITSDTISPSQGSRKRSKRLGRGNASQKGTMSGRGMKGQRARSGGKAGIAKRAFRARLQKIKKLRGFKSIATPKNTVTLFVIDRISKDNDVVTPFYLEEKGVIAQASHGVKVVATGEIKKKIKLEGCSVSKKAVESIEKAGGSVVL